MPFVQRNESGEIIGVFASAQPGFAEEFVDDPAVEPQLSPEQTILKFERVIENHVDEVARSKGYTSIDSIAKYLGSDNVFRAECEALSAWTASVWVSAQTMLNEWQAGNIAQPTIDEVINQLPEPPA